MYLRIVLIEQQKVARRTLFWVELVLAAGLMLLMFGGLFGVRQAISSEFVANSDNVRVEGVEDPAEMDVLLTWPGGIINTLSALDSLGKLLLITLVGAVMAQEYGWRGFGLWLSRGVPRPAVLLSKFVLAATAALLITAVALVTGTLISAGFSQYLSGQIPFEAIDWGAYAVTLLVAAYAMLPYTALALFLGVVSRSTIFTIGVGLTFATLGELLLVQVLPLLGGFWADAVRYLPDRLAASLHTLDQHVAAAGPGAPSASALLAPGTAALVIAFYLLLFAGGALFVFQRQDLGG